MYGCYYSPFHFLGGIVSVLVWILIILIIIKIIKRARRKEKWDHREWQGFVGKNWGRKDAVDILKERYAKGEINKEEFESKKKDLE